MDVHPIIQLLLESSEEESKLVIFSISFSTWYCIELCHRLFRVKDNVRNLYGKECGCGKRKRVLRFHTV